MKKLKVKVFFVIFSLLTVFTLIIFVGGIVKDYMERKNSITEILTRIPKTFENLDRRNRPENFELSYLQSSIEINFSAILLILE